MLCHDMLRTSKDCGIILLVGLPFKVDGIKWTAAIGEYAAFL